MFCQANEIKGNPELIYYVENGNDITAPWNGQLIQEDYFMNEFFIPSQRYTYLQDRYGLQSEMIDLMKQDYDNWQKQKKQMEFNNNLMFGLAIGGVSIGFCGITFGILKGFNII